mgnify:FL=1
MLDCVSVNSVKEEMARCYSSGKEKASLELSEIDGRRLLQVMIVHVIWGGDD